jgi:hypothetical protein
VSGPAGSSDPLWVNVDGSEASDTEEVSFGPRRALPGVRRRRWLFAGSSVLVAVLAVTYATARHHPAHSATHSAAALPSVAPASGTALSVASDTAAVSEVPGLPLQTSFYAPGRVPVSAVLIDDGAGSGSSAPDGTFRWAEELRNVSPGSLTIADKVRVRVVSALPGHVVAAGITANAQDMSTDPPSIRVIKPGQTVSVWVSMHLDCAMIKSSDLQSLAPVIASVTLVGFTGSGEYTMNLSGLGAPFLQRACDG